MAQALAAAGVDIILVETFPHIGEALIAVEEAVATGVPTWVAFTAGPKADLLDVDAIHAGAADAAARGAEVLLVNCIPTAIVSQFLPALADHGKPFGAYGNAGSADDESGFKTSALSPSAYSAAALSWIEMGASIIGGCCGTQVAHIRAIADQLG